MKITLTEAEIAKAIRYYLAREEGESDTGEMDMQIVVAKDASITVTMTVEVAR